MDEGVHPALDAATIFSRVSERDEGEWDERFMDVEEYLQAADAAFIGVDAGPAGAQAQGPCGEE